MTISELYTLAVIIGFWGVFVNTLFPPTGIVIMFGGIFIAGYASIRLINSA